MSPFEKHLQTRGAASDLARTLGVTHAAVYQWVRSRIPADRVISIERATGIPREALRPDLYQRAALLRPKAAVR